MLGCSDDVVKKRDSERGQRHPNASLEKALTEDNGMVEVVVL